MLNSWMNRGFDVQQDGKVGLGAKRRPVIGVALGGGSARGFAHIGILKALIAHGIVPNVVVGTSIGSVVAGAYVAGHLDKLEEWARSLQPRNVFGYLDIRLNGSGLIGGTKLAAELEAYMGSTMSTSSRPTCSRARWSTRKARPKASNARPANSSGARPAAAMSLGARRAG